MDTKEYETYLHEFIPIVKDMDFRVVSYDPDETVIRASFQRNKSKKEIAFGGSIVSLCLASAWSLLKCRMDAEGIAGYIVINRQDAKFRAPIVGDFDATSRFESEEDWSRFKEMYQRMGRARVSIECEVWFDGKLGASFTGLFAVMKD